MGNTAYEEHATQVALARYAVIAPLVTRTLTRGQHQGEKVRILSCMHKFPDGERWVKERTLRRWMEWYQNGHRTHDGVLVCGPGVDALKDAPRDDRGTTRVLSPEIINLAVRLRAQEPARTTQMLIALIGADFAARNEEVPNIEEATLAHHLRQRRATRRQLKREGRAYPRYEHTHRNAVWQGDFSQGIPLPDPTDPKKTRTCYLHAFIDDHSRYIVHAEFYFRQNLPCLEDSFRKAILKGGIPERAYWDNGAVYHSRQIQMVAARLGTHVIFATPYAPEGKGKVERWFQTVKTAFYPEARRANLQTLEELNTFFWGWLEEGYHTRVHSQTGETPKARWEAGAAQVRMPEPASLVDLFLWEETRVVEKTGCIKLADNAYPVGEHLVGRKVEVRFDPFELSKVRIYVDGAFVDTAQPMEMTSRTFRKALPRRAEKPAPLESSEAYRRQVSQGYKREIDGVLASARQPDRLNDCLTRPELAALLCEKLGGRLLTVQEGSALADFFKRYAPLPAEPVRAALLRAVDEKGTQRHIRFYLEAIREGRLEGGARS